MNRTKKESIDDVVIYRLDNVTFRLQEGHDLDWLCRMGYVFAVFDEQDSGNICFGVEKDGRKRFVKYAGARPMEYAGAPEDAVRRLKEAIPLYSILQHETLISLQDYFHTESGYAAVFDWFDGECLHSHWSFPPPAKYNHPESPYYRFRQLPVEKRLQSLDAIFSFHVMVELKGYVAVDFYDGSILYDFSNDMTKICDIDFYRQSPVINEMGEHYWGPTRSKAPEEFELGAAIDASTNVYTMGAIAFGLLGGETDRSFLKWEAGRPLYEAACRAIRKERERRFEDVKSFKAAWDEAKHVTRFS